MSELYLPYLFILNNSFKVHLNVRPAQELLIIAHRVMDYFY